ncbi:MAG: glycosyltransferase involved in cell wall biosynthesis [Polyangiales bacterium]|jgi:glycosyltransferase involved in cell wall biosynthesis
MLGGKRVAVVLPGLNVAVTLERTIRALPEGVADEIILVDDGSTDDSVAIAQRLGLTVVSHAKNLGYGAGQKTGYREALAGGADVVVMVHPDFQYKPELMPAMASMVVHGGYDMALGSRMLMRGALAGGMPMWKYVVNRGLTMTENAVMGAGLSEYHTGYRAFSRKILEELPLAGNRNDFVFDNETIAQALHFGYSIGEMSCPANYFDEMQTITLMPGIRYGLGCLTTASAFFLNTRGKPSPLFDANGPGLSKWTEGVRRKR